MSGDTARTAFFVGYLCMPGRLALFLWLLLPLLLGGVGGAALALAIGNADPGDGGRLPGRITLTGVVQLDPYPMLRLPPDADHDRPWAVLMVTAGKNGAQGRLAGLDGETVAITGSLYERGGQLLFEIRASQDAIVEVDRTAGYRPGAARPLGNQRLVGEIVDPKCHLGSMRPGEGKPHMMCGNRCLLGGIPPTLAVHSPDGTLTMVLLVGADGAPALDAFLDWTSLPVALSGAMFALDDMLVMHVAADGIEGL
ncbi:MAG: hypothetical protein R3F55_07400 [Alphaproteobacteria bacterium]